MDELIARTEEFNRGFLPKKQVKWSLQHLWNSQLVKREQKSQERFVNTVQQRQAFPTQWKHCYVTKSYKTKRKIEGLGYFNESRNKNPVDVVSEFILWQRTAFGKIRKEAKKYQQRKAVVRTGVREIDEKRLFEKLKKVKMLMRRSISAKCKGKKVDFAARHRRLRQKSAPISALKQFEQQKQRLSLAVNVREQPITLKRCFQFVLRQQNQYLYKKIATSLDLKKSASEPDNGQKKRSAIGQFLS